MNHFMEHARIYLTVFISLTVIVGIGISVDGRYAKAEEVTTAQKQITDVLEGIQGELKEMKQETRRDKLQNRIWALEDRYQTMQMPQSVLEEYRQLKVELDILNVSDPE